MSSDVMVFIKIIGDSSSQSSNKFCPLNLNNHFPDIRKELEDYNIINDIISFSKKENDEFAEVVREVEEKFQLKEIIEIINKVNSKSYYLYLMKNSSLSWNVLNEKCKLDYGRTMSIKGIERANKRAFIMKNCELIEIGAEGYKKDRLGFESKEDWMKKRNLFINVDGINVRNFVEFGLSIGSSQINNYNEEIKSTYRYTEIGKVSLKLSKENLELTKDFKNDLMNAILSKDHENFKKITEEYGQFIPTEVVLGGRVYFKDIGVSSESSVDKDKIIEGSVSIGSSNAKIGSNSSDSKKKSKLYSSDCIRILGGNHPDGENFDEKNWIGSLKNFQNWDCIEFKNPINIFQLLSYDLRKKLFISIGKKILYTSTKDFDYDLYEAGMYRIFELNDIPTYISRIIQNEDADCDIFASVINTDDSSNDFFNCQIFRASESKKPSVIIHGIQKKFRKHKKYKLKINIIIIGYDIEFFSNNSVELIKETYNPQSNREFDSITLQLKHKLIERNIPFFGIPILDNLNSSSDSKNSFIIGHNFRILNNELKIDTFSYCTETNCYVNLPNFTFCTLFILNSPTFNSHELKSFEFSLWKNPYIKFEDSNPRYDVQALFEKFLEEHHEIFRWIDRCNSTWISSEICGIPYIPIYPTRIHIEFCDFLWKKFPDERGINTSVAMFIAAYDSPTS
ncbi:hypothetical protein RhiirA1_452074 [Rhizophagus irregularis]|uniref:MACPF domain-containing protein n=1 Tax=Rhizophagus irregularis TaxID=588596 RepID=A0A2N0SAS9_9GLOM|nr:hypothetical protein RhiirA1_452074 [Rhizophagus irregularis]